MKGIIFTAFCIVFSIVNSYACNCEELKIKEAFKKSDLIFTGKLISKELKTTIIKANKIQTEQSYTRMIFVFEVIEIIKGRKNARTITINSKYNNIDFVKDEQYLIYSYFSNYLLTTNFYLNGEKVSPFLATDICTNTKKLSLVHNKVIKKLKKFERKSKTNV